MNNPIFNNRYVRRGVVFELAEDFSTVKITVGNQSVTIEGNAVADLHHVMRDNLFTDGKKMGSERLWNFVQTSLSCPEADQD